MAALWGAYTNALATAPLQTKAATSMVLNALQEYIAQRLSAGRKAPAAVTNAAGRPATSATASAFTVKKGVDAERVVRMALYGLLIGGPVGHYIYRLVNWFFEGRTGSLAALLQLVAVNAIAIPIQNFSTYTHAQSGSGATAHIRVHAHTYIQSATGAMALTHTHTHTHTCVRMPMHT
jgi:hypothetical protein